MSPDGIIAYCQMQLGNIGDQLNGLVQQQYTQVQEQKAISTLKSALEQFGTKGPTNGQEMDQCIAAYNQAINSLPEGDPLRTELQGKCDTMKNKYGYQPATEMPLTTPNATSSSLTSQAPGTSIFRYGNGLVTGSSQLTAPPTDGQWQGTIDDVGGIATTLSSNSQIQMLQISNLASAQQTAVEQAINMLNKMDGTLTDIAKNA
jgi:hypothetical protein